MFHQTSHVIVLLEPLPCLLGTAYHHEKLRQYQLNRLKYYYAVVECDSPETSSAVYDNCDGTEYENSASKIDLRYVAFYQYLTMISHIN